MSTKPRAAISWSGGKDSCAALARARASFDVVAMVTMFDEEAARSRSHGLRPEVLQAQADRLGLRPFIGRCTWQTYDRTFSETLAALASERHHARRVRRHPVRRTSPVGRADVRAARADGGRTAVGLSTDTLFREWVDSGSDAVIVTARAEFLDESWLGRPLRREMLDEFARLGVDPCGERGEYHTVVTDTPLFRSPLTLKRAGHVQRSGCWALDLVVDDADRA